jgi:drug/metabolite transporter (DMT)-like permease
VIERAALAAVGGALCITSSAVLVRLADVSPATAATFRCLYAIPVLAVLAGLENRRFGRRSGRDRALAAAAGVFLAVDLDLWHHAIADVGAGVATVLGNLQVVAVAVAAWLLLGERPGRRLLVAVPVVLTGVVLVSGVVGAGAYGDSPPRGVAYGLATSVAYAACLLLLRRSAADLRRPAGPLLDVTAVSAVASAMLGAATDGVTLSPSWPAHGWLILLALLPQVAGWLLISVSLPRLPAAVTSLILLLQPVGAMALAALVLAERPSSVQLVGCVVVLAGVAWGASARRTTPTPARAEEAILA